MFATTQRCGGYAELIDHVTEEYRDRWGIETGYRCAKSIRPRTVSRNPVLRMFLFYVSLAVCNIWMTVRDSDDPRTRSMTLQTPVTLVAVYAMAFCAQDACRAGAGRRHDPG